MSTQKHTSGPWKTEVGVASQGLGRNGIYHAIVKGKHKYTVAHTEEITGDVKTTDLGRGYVRRELINPRTPQREPHPDAHLIAAAPELYETLERIVKSLDGEEGPHNFIHINTTLDDAKAALAKARGETP